jgi:hypothetical protein
MININFNFKDRQSELTPSKVKNLRILQLRNFRPDIKYVSFPPGAINVDSYEAEISKFKDTIDFFMHLVSLGSLEYDNYDLSENFFLKEHKAEILSKEEFLSLANGYMEGYRDFTETEFWNFKINNDDFKEGYKLKELGSGLFLFGATGKSYFAFIYEAID